VYIYRYNVSVFADILLVVSVMLYWHPFLFVFSYSWQNHNLSLKFDFHSYMIRSMEEEFQRIVGVR
jgi:hypothetical protein